MLLKNIKILPLKILGGAIFFVLCLIQSAAFGIRYEGEDLTNQSTNPMSSMGMPTSPKAPTLNQLRSADEFQKKGCVIRWDGVFNTPTFIRGTSLGAAISSGQVGLLSFSGKNYAQKAVAVLEKISPLYGVQNIEQDLISEGTEQADQLGYRHLSFRQSHRGIPVLGAGLKVHFNQKGDPYEVSGLYVPAINLNANPSISSDQAVSLAKSDFQNRGAIPQDIVLMGDPQLIIYAVNHEPVLVFQVVLRTRPDQSWKYWIDAHTGAIVRAINNVCKIVAPTKGGGISVNLTGARLTGEGGAVVTWPGWNENSAYYMYDPTNYYFVWNAGQTTNSPPTNPSLGQTYGSIQTKIPAHLVSSLSPAVAQGFVDSLTYAYRGTLDWGITDRNEVSVASNMQKVFEYYRLIHNRNGVDGANGTAGTAVPAVVHYDVDYVNAFWDGVAMYFGDGDGYYSDCMAVLDVCGHELTHGVTEKSANLVYQDESGALNESFSDIFGATIELYAQPDGRSSYPGDIPGTGDWKCGEDCWLDGSCLRDLRNPSSTVTMKPGYQQPSKYGGAYWQNYNVDTSDNGGVHQNSGVQNFFYYLLCEGGSGNNNGISYNVQGITIANARQIAYRALTVYCNPNTDYRAARQAWISAAADINTNWVSNVKAAWDAVGIVEPSITSPSAWSAIVNHPMLPYTIAVKSIDSPTSYGVTSLPPGLTLVGTKISGTPTGTGSFASTITVSTPSETITGPLVFTISDPPPYDDFAQAKTISPLVPSSSGTTSGYSFEQSEPAHATGGPYNSIWFKMTPTQNGLITLSTEGSDFDTVMAVYKGTALNRLTKVAANNDAGGGKTFSRVQFTMSSGTTYYIAIDGNKGATGNYNLVATGFPAAPPVNDPFGNPTDLGSASNFNNSGTLLGASAQSGEPALAGFAASRSVWFSWTAPASGELTLDTMGSQCDTVLGLYSGNVSGTNWSSLKLIAANDNSSATNQTSKFTTVVSNGVNYRIKIDGRSYTNGDYVLNGILKSFPTLPAPSGLTFTLTNIKSQNYQPKISWNQVPSSLAYEVNLLKGSNRINGLSTTNTNWTNGPLLLLLSNQPASTYGVQVRAISNTITSPWSAVIPGSVVP